MSAEYERERVRVELRQNQGMVELRIEDPTQVIHMTPGEAISFGGAMLKLGVRIIRSQAGPAQAGPAQEVATAPNRDREGYN